MAAQTLFPVPIADLVQGVRAGDRALLARAITLIESNRPAHQPLAQRLLLQLLPDQSNPSRSHRIGITGVPGVGKSTFIEAFGRHLIAQGHKVAVLAIDPSSQRSGGSILGDKTRMAHLGVDPNAFIRPSPAAGRLGGVHRKTRETILLCEAAGYDIILVETVGAGQNEISVADMVDSFLILMLPGAGDDLQGLKKGILEHADIIAIHKADGDNADSAQQAAHQYRTALHVLQSSSSSNTDLWSVPVMTCSSITGKNMDQVWQTLSAHKMFQINHDLFQETRHRQNISWMWAMVEDQLMDRLYRHPDIQAELPHLLQDLSTGRATPASNARQLLSLFTLPDTSDAPPVSAPSQEQK